MSQTVSSDHVSRLLFPNSAEKTVTSYKLSTGNETSHMEEVTDSYRPCSWKDSPYVVAKV